MQNRRHSCLCSCTLHNLWKYFFITFRALDNKQRNKCVNVQTMKFLTNCLVFSNASQHLKDWQEGTRLWVQTHKKSRECCLKCVCLLLFQIFETRKFIFTPDRNRKKNRKENMCLALKNFHKISIKLPQNVQSKNWNFHLKNYSKTNNMNSHEQLTQ